MTDLELGWWHEPAAWRARADCSEVDPELWFPKRGSRPSRKVLEICGRCDVREECLETALASSDPPYGIWGGTTEGERRALRRERKRVS